MLSDKTFFLGIGAQKAGTTWLSDYLSKRPEFFVHPLKEVHFFDVMYRRDLCGYFDDWFSKKLSIELKGRSFNDIKKDRKLFSLVARVLMSGDEDLYQRYFESVVSKEHLFYGEITPSYSLIGEDGFKDIGKKYPNLKVVFLMRDPVDRHISAYKMSCKQRGVECNFNSKDFRSTLSNLKYLERTAYDKTITALDRSFDVNQVFYGFYENLFCDQTIMSLCNFFGIPFVSANYGKRINSASEKYNITSDVYQLLRETYRDVYSFCESRFGSEVHKLWDFR